MFVCHTFISSSTCSRSISLACNVYWLKLTIQSSWHEMNSQRMCLQNLQLTTRARFLYQLLLRVMQYPRIFTWTWVTRLCLYSVGGITRRDLHVFIFEWGNVLRVSLFGINVSSVLQDLTLSFYGDKIFLPKWNVTQIFLSTDIWSLHAICRIRNTPTEPRRLHVTPLQPLVTSLVLVSIGPLTRHVLLFWIRGSE